MFILKIIGFLYRQLCSLQSRCCSYKVYVVRSKWWCFLCKVVILCTKVDIVCTNSTFLVQNWFYLYTHDIVHSMWQCCLCKVIILCTNAIKSMLFMQSFEQRKKKIGKLILTQKPLHTKHLKRDLLSNCC